jgi:UDP-N-acetylmuramoyl-tripeptide--D-alanyl-D-alanine ligase
MNLSTRDLVRAAGGRRVHGVDRPIGHVSIDSRSLPPLATFFCLRGPRFDAHDFAESVMAQGAGVIVCDDIGMARLPRSVRTGPATIVCVPDTEQALVALAAEARAAFQGTVVGITGSVGKTTTKELLAAVLARGGATLKTHGNQNNQLGVPLTLLRLTPDLRFAVVEMGTNAPGEIAALAHLGRPQHGVLTSVGAAHLEGLGGLAGVAREKGDLLRALPTDGLAFMPEDIAQPWHVTRNVLARLITVGVGEGSGLRRLSQRETAAGAVARISVNGAVHTLRLAMPGVHNLDNALLALACGLALGVSLDDALAALAQVPPASMRGEIRRLTSGVRVLLDCYNANPASMQASLRTFARIAPQGVAVLGDMLELGPTSEIAHREMGAFVSGFPGLSLVAVGPRARAIFEAARDAGLPGERLAYAPDATAAGEVVANLLRRSGRRWLLLKGSRGIGLERIHQYLTGESPVEKGHG